MAIDDVRPLPELTTSEIARFWSRVDVRGPDECWPWNRRVKSGTYGHMNIRGQIVVASRVAYFLQHGEDPFPLMVCHTCDYPPCSNGKHLFKGTALENTLDAKSKGRTAIGDRNGSRLHPERVPRGDNHSSRTHPELRPRGDKHWARIYPEFVKRRESHYSFVPYATRDEIRALYSNGLSLRQLAKQFDISKSTVSNIIHRRPE